MIFRAIGIEPRILLRMDLTGLLTRSSCQDLEAGEVPVFLRG